VHSPRTRRSCIANIPVRAGLVEPFAPCSAVQNSSLLKAKSHDSSSAELLHPQLLCNRHTTGFGLFSAFLEEKWAAPEDPDSGPQPLPIAPPLPCSGRVSVERLPELPLCSVVPVSIVQTPDSRSQPYIFITLFDFCVVSLGAGRV
jgi:hypothetical protein